MMGWGSIFCVAFILLPCVTRGQHCGQGRQQTEVACGAREGEKRGGTPNSVMERWQATPWSSS
eukprot:4939078-Amphidinium_carterae.3